ncbi:MAG: sodium:solute symporter family transporter, partial [Limisphaerales bacterium]
MTPLIVIVCYLGLLLALGILSSRSFRGTSKDYFVASHSIGPFLLLMSVFGTTMTAFALVGSTGKAFERGIGVYGLMASISGLVHAAVFFLIGIRLWVFGKKYGYVTQIQYFRARFESSGIGYLLFPILVLLVIPYLLIGIIGAGKTLLPVTAGAFPDLFPNLATPQWAGGIPVWLTGLVICGVVLTYVFMGGSRGAAWANTFQTLVFMVMGVVAFVLIAKNLGGLENASKVTIQINEKGQVVQPYRWDNASKELVENNPPKVVGKLVFEGESPEPGTYSPRPLLSRTVTEVELNSKNPKTGEITSFKREYGIPPWMFATYLFIPLSVGMFPHLFQHWLTAKSAKAFKLTVIAHPLFILIVWVPCVLIGIWATGILPPLDPSKVSGVLGQIVGNVIESQVLSGFLTAGVLA